MYDNSLESSFTANLIMTSRLSQSADINANINRLFQKF